MEIEPEIHDLRHPRGELMKSSSMGATERQPAAVGRGGLPAGPEAASVQADALPGELGPHLAHVQTRHRLV
jgi:hypothetical protein